MSSVAPNALLLLDLQNNFIGEGSLLPVESPSSYVDNIRNLIEPFRPSGDIIWICSNASEGISRIINQPRSDSEAIITNNELPRSRRDKLTPEIESNHKGEESKLSVASNDDDAKEAFLTITPGEKADMLKPNTRGSDISDAFTPISAKDLVFHKTYYSAFKDGNLVQKLRGKFVTEIYIAGALTNVSVFATAMDAARHGYAITIIEDCLGYRSKARHDEALRQLKAYTGSLKGERLPLEAADPQATTATIPSVTVTEEDFETTRQLLRAQVRRAKSPAELEAEAKKREKVKSKVRTRRHASKPVETPESSSELKERSPASSRSPSAGLSESPCSAAKADLPSPKSVDGEKEKLQQKPSSKKDTPGDMQKDKDTPLTDTRGICEGDTTVIHKLLPEELARGIFERIRDEILWQKMVHQGGEVPRLVAVQGQIEEDGSIPIYRHPADESPNLLSFSPTVEIVRKMVEKRLGHPLNHVLIQFYRDGNDHISEHSDKTLDIVPNTFIANVSLGAQRTMVFRRKKPVKSVECTDSQPIPRESCREALPHNSLCKMGLKTNKNWLHSIRPDKRMANEKSEAELAHDCGRISLTFRHIGTYLDKDQQKIWGQGATAKKKEDAKPVINGDTLQSQNMLQAFGKENHDSNFDWQEIYGKGLDVLHILNSKKLFLSGDSISDYRVKFMLSEYNIPWIEATISPPFHWERESPQVDGPLVPEILPIKFIDNDSSKTTVEGCMPIMFYLEAIHGPQKDCKSPSHLARHYTRFEQTNTLLKTWQTIPFSVKPFRAELVKWNAYAQEAEYIAGDKIGLADFAIIPVFELVSKEWGDCMEFDSLAEYWKNMMKINALKKEKQKIERSEEDSSVVARKDMGNEIEQLLDGISNL
ncbi:hypothetical protein EYC80_008388 [Monilinia laxa]|uniref:Fe2OG dioxygenase domain-containing protein n=1 Tax=Monilinia laxa TaxID=61186 RepID=A0A5N6JSZ0_MONLA|nr:hypothetical protein EYC80_008388 [Monilinia laxa]